MAGFTTSNNFGSRSGAELTCLDPLIRDCPKTIGPQSLVGTGFLVGHQPADDRSGGVGISLVPYGSHRIDSRSLPGRDVTSHKHGA